MKLTSKMSFEECLAELQGILYIIKANGGCTTMGTERRKTYLAEAMINMDWKKFFQIYHDQFEDFSHLIVRKAVHESPIMLLELLQIAPNRLNMSLSLISEVTPLSLRKKQVDAIVKCIQDGMKFSNLSYWDDLFEILESNKPEAVEFLSTIWLEELSDYNSYNPKEKLHKAENFLNNYLPLLSDTTKSRMGTYIKDCKNQLEIEQFAQHDAYSQRVIAHIEQSIASLSKFIQSVNEDFIVNQLKTDLKNKEELLHYDMEFTDNLYHSLNKDQIFIAHGDDEMQYVSHPFYILNDIEVLLYNLNEFFNSKDVEVDFKELLKEFNRVGQKRFVVYLDSYDPADRTFEAGWLDDNAEVEQNYWEGAYAGISSYYFIKKKDYSETVIELKQICLILVDWAEKSLNQ